MFLMQLSVSGIQSGVTSYVQTSIVNTYLTSSNLVIAGLSIGGFGVCISPAFKNTGKMFIGLGVLLVAASAIALFYGH